MVITKIEVQKNNKNRVNLFVDDEFCCGLSVETIMKNNLKVGKDINEELLNYYKVETEREVALNKAVNYISKQAKTEKQVKDYLIKKGFETDVVFEVLSKLKEYSFINDENYAKQFVKFKTKKNGKRKILMDLKRNGVDEETANKSIGILCNDKESIVSIAEKYLKNKTLDLKTKQKTYRHLISKGYEMDDVVWCLNQFFKD